MAQRAKYSFPKQSTPGGMRSVCLGLTVFFTYALLTFGGVTDPTSRPSNHLAGEASPYLRQHQYNPVDWYPWGEAAFEKARDEHKPIFLSIGYSTCHWCHVMEKESFENPEVAAILNEYFVCIKVDREERPDIDRIYLTFVQSLTGGAGWPLNVFLTPDLEPFFGGTYLPLHADPGGIAFPDLLQKIARLWTDNPQQLKEQANAMTEHLRAFMQKREVPADQIFQRKFVEHAALQFEREYDADYGGFGQAPKFPMPSILAFLMHYAHSQPSGSENCLRMVSDTCDHMAQGGLWDALGGGFSRYTVDAAWKIPHFEKMLYDNAQLLEVYLDLYLLRDDPRYLDIAKRIASYVRRDLMHENGGFFCAEDADSEGVEGAFYLWTYEELEAALEPEALRLLKAHFQIVPEGNLPDDANSAWKPGQLNLVRTGNLLPAGAESERLDAVLQTLFELRQQRIRPHRDEKILASWNGLMIGSIARLAAVTGDSSHLQMMQRSIDFVQSNLWDASSQRLHHRWADGAVDEVQLLSAYAFLLDGMIKAYETTLKPEYLEFSDALAQAMIDRFYDETSGGFWISQDDGTQILRMKDEHDGPEPAANSVAVLALLKLAAITENPTFQNAAVRTLEYYRQDLDQRPHDFPYLLQALHFHMSEVKHVVISTGSDTAAASKGQALIRAVHAVYHPNKVVMGTAGKVNAFAATLESDTAAAFICHGSECSLPTSDPSTIQELLLQE